MRSLKNENVDYNNMSEIDVKNWNFQGNMPINKEVMEEDDVLR